jgi:hypothetical protein
MNVNRSSRDGYIVPAEHRPEFCIQGGNAVFYERSGEISLNFRRVFHTAMPKAADIRKDVVCSGDKLRFR